MLTESHSELGKITPTYCTSSRCAKYVREKSLCVVCVCVEEKYKEGVCERDGEKKVRERGCV